jgi:hypothetical protein
MKAYDKQALFRGRLRNLARRALGRLEFFPLTVLYLLINAGRKARQRRSGLEFVEVGIATSEADALPRDMMLWLSRILRKRQGQSLDVCVRLSQESTNTGLPGAFSAALAFPRLRSIALYWDAASLADDLPLLRSTQDRTAAPAAAALSSELAALPAAQWTQLLRASAKEFALPPAASRDAQTFLKRQGGVAPVICFNVPAGLDALAEAAATARPDARFLDFASPPSGAALASNRQSLFGWGFNLHERMALVQAADAYVGVFDELGCVALLSGRPALLLDTMQTALPVNELLDFLSRHLATPRGATPAQPSMS